MVAMRSSRFEEACAVSVLVSLFALAWGQPDVVIDTTIQLQRDRIVVGTVQTLTTLANKSELSADANGATFLQGFRFWVDQTNQQGGITLGTRKVQVELAYYDDQGSIAPTAQRNRNLISRTYVECCNQAIPRKQLSATRGYWSKKARTLSLEEVCWTLMHYSEVISACACAA